MAGWIIGIFMAVLAVLGLLMSSHAADSNIAWVGILFFLYAVGYIYSQIMRNIG